MNKRADPQYIIDPVSGCWEWQWARNHDGYGWVWHAGRSRFAHRVYFEREHGAISDGMMLDHLCGNRGCCNPSHLEVVTAQINTHRGRRSKLTAELAAAIRHEYAEGGTSHRKLAAKYGVTHHCISLLVRGKTWRTADPNEAILNRLGGTA